LKSESAAVSIQRNLRYRPRRSYQSPSRDSLQRRLRNVCEGKMKNWPVKVTSNNAISGFWLRS
jgi:hypothetical protein